TVLVTLTASEASINTSAFSATITDGTDSDTNAITGTFALSFVINPSTFSLVGTPTLTGFDLSVDKLHFALGSFLTIDGAGLHLNPAATGTEELITVGSASATLTVSSLSIAGTASNFAILGNGNFLAKQNFGISLTLGQGQDASSLGWPSWFPLQSLSIGLQW